MRISTSYLKSLISKYDSGEISLSRFTELINEKTKQKSQYSFNISSNALVALVFTVYFICMALVMIFKK